MKKEENLQIQVCQYIKLQYSDIIFFSDASGIRLTIGQAVKAKKMRSGRAIPDLFIAEPKSGFCGLFIELKTLDALNKNGTIKKTPHTDEQDAMLTMLRRKGYYAVFCFGFEHAKSVIDNYINHR